MKKMFFALMAMLTMAVLPMNAMTYEQARNEALFLTDKMAYELNLSDAQYEAAYEINLDYLMSVTGYNDVGGLCWERRNADLRHILYSWQWDAFCAATYFFRPLYWEAGYWHFGVYARYPRRDYLYFGRPHFYASYRGGHSWHMNGGRSFYEHRHNHFRPGNVGRDHHVGMRSSFDRGDYRRVPHGNSSTRITAGNRHDNDRHYGGNRDNGSWRSNGGRNGGSHGNSGSYGNTGNRRGNSDGHSGSSHSGSGYNGGSHSGSNGGSGHSGSSHSSGGRGSIGGSSHGASGGSHVHSAAPTRSGNAGGGNGGTRSGSGRR